MSRTSHRRKGGAGPRPVSRRAAAVTAPALLLTLVLAGCSDDPPRAQDAAAALAAGIADGDVSGLDFTETAAADVQSYLTAVFEPLADLEHTVTVSGTEVAGKGEGAGERATATLAYTWQVTPDQAWQYTTTVDLDLESPADGKDGEPHWAVAWEPDVLIPDLEHGDRLAVDRIRPERADILGADDTPIVTDRPVMHVGIDKTHVDPAAWDARARELAAAVGIDPEAYAQSVAGAGEKAFVEAITLRTGDPEAAAAIERARSLDGVSLVEDEIPLAPTRDFARPILGRVGDATAEVVDGSDGAVVAGDTVGLSGLQRQYDEQLRGTPGVGIQIVPDGTGSAGDEPVDAFRAEPVDGIPLRTTLRADMQLAAEGLLAGQTVPSAIVAIQPSTGAVLAAASGTAGEGVSTATLGKYAPGSTFKVVTALAMLRAGLTVDTVVPCTPEIAVDGRTFQNVPGYPSSALGDVPLRTAFANSCNTAMISQAGTVTQQGLHNAAADLGLGVEADLGAAGYFGNVPTDATGTEHAASMIGQGKVEASPLAMATIAASVAAGHRVSPVLVQPDAKPSADEEETASALTQEEAATLRSLMRSVVTDGSAVVLADLPGEVGAKTGTAQYGDGTQAHTWMIATQGDLAVAVFVETGESGSATAGPLMHAFLEGSGGA